MKNFIILITLLIGSIGIKAQDGILLVGGASSVCQGQTETYSAGGNRCLGTKTWSWSAFGGTIIGSSNQSTVQIRWNNSGIHQVNVTMWCTSDGDIGIFPDRISKFGGTTISTGSISVTVNGNAPSAPSMQDGAACDVNTTIRLAVSSPQSGYTYKWYTSATSTNPIATTHPKGNYHDVIGSQTFYVAAFNGSCEGARSVVKSSVVGIPEAPIVRGSQYYCETDFISLTAVSLNETPVVYEWYKVVGLNQTLIYTGNRLNAPPNIATYAVRAIVQGSTCASGYTTFQVLGGKPRPVLSQVPINAHRDKIFDEANTSVKAQLASPTDGNEYYWNMSLAYPATTPQYLQHNQQITLSAYKDGCWSAPKTYTAVGKQTEDFNWTLSRIFDENGNVISTSKSYFDEGGKPLQTQSKVFTDEKVEVFASQPVYDGLNRASVNTLAAPINREAFGYKSDFVTVEGESMTEATFTQPVDDATEGTLGWYYSHNNTKEPLQAVTDYPFSRAEFYDDGTGAVRRGGGAGDHFAITADPNSGKYSFNKNFPLLQEMDEYLQIKYTHVFPSQTQNIQSLAFKGSKVVSRNIDGKESVSFTDLSGHSVASALAGPTYTQKTVTLSAPLGFPVFWSTFDWATSNIEEEKIRLQIGGTECVQVFRKFDGQSWEKVYEGDPFNVDVYKSGATEVNVRTGTDPQNMQIQVRVFERFTLRYSEAEEWLTPDLSEVEGGMCVLDFHIAETAMGTTPFTIHTENGVELPVSLIQLDNVTEKFKEILSPNLVVDKTVQLTQGFYRLKVGGDFALDKQMPALDDYSNLASVSYQYQIGGLAYHFYDETGRLRCSISPNGVKQLLEEGVPYSQIDKTTYTYTSDGRVLDMTELDAGKTEYLYRKDGAIRFSQSAKQKLNNKFSYTAYDEDGRPIESGEYEEDGGSIFESHLTDQPHTNSALHLLENIGLDGLDNTYTFDLTRTFYDEADPSFTLREQNFLLGNVAYSQFVGSGEENDIISQTWFSYDDLGRVEWVAQKIDGLADIKLVEYTYDYFGKVTQVAYQANTAEAFYHKYSYDANQRLKIVETSRDGQTWKEQAEYIYYLHGPLKRVELGEDLQGIDYAYTLHGWLKSINNIDVNSDMGADGLTNDFAADIFSMQLEYFEGDYTSAKLNNPIANLNTPQKLTSYTGNINAMAWRTQKPGEDAFEGSEDAFSFEYDEKYQLKTATFGAIQQQGFVADASDKFKVNLDGYDLNGNIQGLTRKDESGAVRDHFRYHYIGHTNQLERVEDLTQANSNYAEYTYNVIGELIAENNTRDAKDLNIIYDAYGKVIEVEDNGVLLAKYSYNERGKRIKKKVFNTTGQAKTTFYVRDVGGNVLSIYEEDEVLQKPLAQTEIPLYGMSRLGQLKPRDDGSWGELYELKDHLGNVRATFRKGDYGYVNSYYTDIANGTYVNGQPASTDEPVFEYLNTYYEQEVQDYFKGHNDNRSIQLDGDDGATQFGPHIWLPVKNGEDLFAEIFFTADELPDNGGLPQGRKAPNKGLVAGSLLSLTTPNVGGSTETGRKTPQINLNLLAIPGVLNIKKTIPKTGYNGSDINYYSAWVRMELYSSKDASTDPVESKSAQIILLDGEEGQWKFTSLHWSGLKLPDDWCEGYVKVYIENQGSETIWFDDFTVEKEYNAGKVEVVSYTDYYPFGAEMRGSCISGSRYGYQGDFAEKDEETGWSAFELRMYDPVIGRMLNIDPYRQYYSPYKAMGNNPIIYNDSDGGWAQIAIGAAIGAAISVAVEVYTQVSEGNIVYNGGLDLQFKENALAKVGIAFLEGAVAGGAVASGVALFGATTGATTVLSGYSAVAVTGGLGGFVSGTGAELARQHLDGDINVGDALLYGVKKGVLTAVGTHYGGKFISKLRLRNWSGTLNRNVVERLAYNFRDKLPVIGRAVTSQIFSQGEKFVGYGYNEVKSIVNDLIIDNIYKSLPSFQLPNFRDFIRPRVTVGEGTDSYTDYKY